MVILVVDTIRRMARMGSSRVTAAELAGGPLLVSTLVTMVSLIVGVRVMFSLPLALPSNWIFRITEVHPPAAYVKAVRTALFVLAVIPAWILSAVLCLLVWPWRPAMNHLAVLAVWGLFVAYLALYGFRKVPFTCSYLPGKTRFAVVVMGSAGLLVLLIHGVEFELRALRETGLFLKMLGVLGVAAAVTRWRTVSFGDVDQQGMQFEDLPPPATQVLGLSRDGSPIRG